MTDTVIKVENLSKIYRLGELHKQTNSFREKVTHSLRNVFVSIGRAPNSILHAPCHMPLSSDDSIWALRNVSFEVKQGEIVGIIGRNGAGKSTLLKILSRITKPTEGKAFINGRVASLLEVGTGFHPELTGRENIFLNGAILGMTKYEIRNKFNDIVNFAEIKRFIDTPVKRYSTGMHVRLAFAVAAHLDPEILLIDEVLAVGDLHFQKKCIGKIGDISKKGKTVLFVSHNIETVGRLCSKCILLKNGSILENNETRKVIEIYFQSSIELEGSWKSSSIYEKTKSINLLSVNIVDLHGRKRGVVSYSDGFMVEITYQTFIKDRDFVIALRITNSASSDIFTTWDTDLNHNRRTFQGNFYKATCFIPGKILRPGIYKVSVLCNLLTNGKIRTNETATLYLVISETGYHINRGRVGIITPIFEWNTVKVSKPERLQKSNSY